MVSGKGNKAALRTGAYQQETSAWKVPRHLNRSTNYCYYYHPACRLEGS